MELQAAKSATQRLRRANAWGDESGNAGALIAPQFGGDNDALLQEGMCFTVWAVRAVGYLNNQTGSYPETYPAFALESMRWLRTALEMKKPADLMSAGFFSIPRSFWE
ncbi:MULTISPECIES: hypothetical protein [Chromobacterium]|uniref:hypothetical protein n=1 Tax=Chromobacterium sp. F49 TaxID=1777131 RepID=UPI0015E685C3|nr:MULTISPECIES: hypothetical protein [Chromobacterium]